MNNEMPERLNVIRNEDGIGFIGYERATPGVDYIHHDLYNEAMRQNAALKEQLFTQPSRAQVAREFLKDCFIPAPENEQDLIARMWRRLSEWEAAEVNNAESK